MIVLVNQKVLCKILEPNHGRCACCPRLKWGHTLARIFKKQNPEVETKKSINLSIFLSIIFFCKNSPSPTLGLWTCLLPKVQQCSSSVWQKKPQNSKKVTFHTWGIYIENCVPDASWGVTPASGMKLLKPWIRGSGFTLELLPRTRDKTKINSQTIFGDTSNLKQNKTTTKQNNNKTKKCQFNKLKIKNQKIVNNNKNW